MNLAKDAVARKMTDLQELLKRAQLEPAAPLAGSPEIRAVVDNSRKVQSGDLFVALRGTQVDSHAFLAEVAAAGAAAIAIEADYAGAVPEIPVVRVENTRRALGRLAHAIRGFPARRMTVCGVTGTNGKSTVAHLMEGVLRAAGRSPGLFGTIVTRYGGQTFPAGCTTPGPLELAAYLDEMAQAGVDALTMEVSSHGIDQHRVAGIEFDCGILTNITRDHLDYHGDMDGYAAVKKRFFTEFARGRCAINLDCEYAADWLPELGSRALTYGAAESAQVRLLEAESTLAGTRIAFSWNGRSVQVRSPLRGAFNIENLLAAAAGGVALDLPLEQVQAGLEAVAAVPGRFEALDEGQDFDVIVDFAHTPDALERVLRQCRELARGRLVVVFGAGGDRDATKRGPMGQAAGRYSDWVIVTNDNPRTEDPRQIADAVLAGVLETASKAVQVDLILDRKQAIDIAIAEARGGDLVVLAGKGHESYEVVGRELLPFDDREVARAALRTATADSHQG